ncbi:ABC transporter permease [Streptomyces benahoarensis]|uniref:ABC transporter permease n=1 Tax=Streptomyces benahoarensis TaxID=2595054 RepID=A0A553ZHX4_9ACTN|nr:ABC transporter permease [Streptomyces benahoarensis]TSB29380.1 ABC transporter permease [Streptomyces benahoarensis]TSB41072.1 ABC transporter permease [Streptomyces benahoarensis]
MTAPLTPRDNQPPEEPHTPPTASGAGSSAEPPSHPPTGNDAPVDPPLGQELREAALTVLVLALVGALLGLLWLWLAPRIPLVADTHNVYLKDTEGEEAIGADGVFLLIAAGFGIVSAAVLFRLRRRGGVPLVIALAVGGLLGSVLGWQLGMVLGPTDDLAAHAAQVGPGVVFDGPLRLQAMGVLLAWPIAAMVTHLALTGLFGPRDEEPPLPGTPVPGAPDLTKDDPAA